MAGKTLRTGVIGGSINNAWAGQTHIPAIKQLDNLELAAVGTSNMKSAQESADSFGADHAFADEEELAQHSDVDMAVVSVNVKKHYDTVRNIISAGKPIYCEWPLGSNIAEALEMQEWVEREQLPTAIGLQARQAPVVNYIKDLIEEGYVGEVLSAELTVALEGMGGVADEANTYLFDRKAGGNLLTIVGGHNLDAFTYMLGDFKELSALTAQQFPEVELTDSQKTIEKTTDDQIIIAGKLSGGGTANVHIQGGVNHESNLSLKIYGKKSTLVLKTPGSIQFGPYQLQGAGNNDEELRELNIPEEYYWVNDSLKDGPDVVLNVAQAHSKFAKEIREKTKQIPDFKEAVKLHKLLDTIEKAGRTGERQYL